MTRRWDQEGIPHKGWRCIDVIDIREDGTPAEETDYQTCMMCGNEKIRYVHVLQHPDISEDYEVGCVCAEKMTDDYVGPRNRENILRNRSNRRITWLKRKWKISKNGSKYLNIDNNNIGIFKDKKNPNKYRCWINKKFGTILYDSEDAAKLGLFQAMEKMKERNTW